MVTATWRATSSEDLPQVGGWVHDAYFDWDRISFDAARGVVSVPFSQEPADVEECGQPGAQLVGRSRFGARVYKVRFVRCTATIGLARGYAVDNRHRDDPGMLNLVEATEPGEIVFVPVTGPEVRIAVDGIDVRVEMTDELAFYVRRTEHIFGISDKPWDTSASEGQR